MKFSSFLTWVFIPIICFASACSGGGSGSGNANANTTLTGSLTASSDAALSLAHGARETLLRSAGPADCDHGIVNIRAVDESGASYDASVQADCSFSIQLPPQLYIYVNFLDSDGAVVAALTWQDPTQFDDGQTVYLTSFFKMADSAQFNLGSVAISNTSTFAIYSPSSTNSFPTDTLIAYPENPPGEIDSDGDGVPDSDETGFWRGVDANGDGVPDSQVSSADCTLPASGNLYGRIKMMLFRNVGDGCLREEDMQNLRDNRASLPANTTLSATGLTHGPISARGVYVVFGDMTNPNQIAMSDENGNVTIDASKIPSGVAFAKVYKNLNDDEPLMRLPLCLLKTNQDEVSDATAITQYRLYPSICGMNSGDADQCNESPSDEEIAQMEAEMQSDASISGIESSLRRGITPFFLKDEAGGSTVCTMSNFPPCCLDYDGIGEYSARPTGSFARFLGYVGSTCERYVDAGCCVNEGGTLGETIRANLGSLGLVRCWRNHFYRNCQTVDLEDDGLVFTQDQLTRSVRYPYTSPESITVNCGSTTTLYHYNNTCQNHDNIVLASSDCGTLAPSGTKIEHELVGRDNQVDRNIIYTAPATPCTNVATSQAWGMSRVINITVECEETPISSDATGLFNDVNGVSYSGDGGCGLSDFTVDTSSGSVALDSFGSNGDVGFTLVEGSTTSATAGGLTIYGEGGHDCSASINSSSLDITVSCQKGASSCSEVFSRM